MTGNLHEDQYTVLIMSHLILLRLRNVSDKSCRANKKHIFSNFFPEYRTVYEICGKIM